MEQKQDNQTIYNFKNGYPIRYCLPYDRKDNHYSRFRRAGVNYDGFRKALASKTKLGLPLLELVSSYKTPIFAADFDYLPENFNSYDHFYEYLHKKYKDIGMVTRSASGKTKILIQFEIVDENNWLEDVDALGSLKSVLDGVDYEYIDKVATALTKCYLTPIMFEQFKTWNPVYHPAVINEQVVEINKKMLTYTFGDLDKWYNEMGSKEQYLVQLVLEQLDISMSRSNLALRKNLSIFLVRYKSQLQYGFRINQEVMSILIGCQRKTAGKILKTLIKQGLLEKAGSYVKGKQANKYAATAPLLAIYSTFEPTVNRTSSEVPKVDLDAPIVDGMANQQYLRICRYLKSTELSDKEIVEKMVEIDRRRESSKQRHRNYFSYMVDTYK